MEVLCTAGNWQKGRGKPKMYNFFTFSNKINYLHFFGVYISPINMYIFKKPMFILCIFEFSLHGAFFFAKLISCASPSP